AYQDRFALAIVYNPVAWSGDVAPVRAVLPQTKDLLHYDKLNAPLRPRSLVDNTTPGYLAHEWTHWWHYELIRYSKEWTSTPHYRIVDGKPVRDELLDGPEFERAKRLALMYETTSVSQRDQWLSDIRANNFDEDWYSRALPGIRTTYGSTSAREMIAEAGTALFHPDESAADVLLNKTLRNIVSSLFMFGDASDSDWKNGRPWDAIRARDEALSSGVISQASRTAFQERMDAARNEVRDRINSRLSSGDDGDAPSFRPPRSPQRVLFEDTIISATELQAELYEDIQIVPRVLPDGTRSDDMADDVAAKIMVAKHVAARVKWSPDDFRRAFMPLLGIDESVVDVTKVLTEFPNLAYILNESALTNPVHIDHAYGQIVPEWMYKAQEWQIEARQLLQDDLTSQLSDIGEEMLPTEFYAALKSLDEIARGYGF
ncbi:MAG: hypothetical protein EBU84_20080, partial [Actinobacteria bacterium]|nr:hypothetical protein [Actinomycetota bacterium]